MTHPHASPAGSAGFNFAAVIWLVIGVLVVGGFLFVVNKLPITEPTKAMVNVIVLLGALICAVLWIARAAGIM